MWSTVRQLGLLPFFEATFTVSYCWGMISRGHCWFPCHVPDVVARERASPAPFLANSRSHCLSTRPLPACQHRATSKQMQG